MKRQDVKDAMSQVSRFWPRADWEPEIQMELARRMLALPLDLAQVTAALVNLRLECKYQTISPAEVFTAISRAAGGRGERPVDPKATAAELFEMKTLQASGRFDFLAQEWLAAQGSKFAHWEPAWLAAADEPAKWFWGRRFLHWARGRWSATPLETV